MLSRSLEERGMRSNAALTLLLGAFILAQALPARAVGEELSTPEAEDSAYRADARNARSFSDMVERLIVTARKREEYLREVPIAVSAMTRDELVEQNLRRLDDVQAQVPNLLLDNTVGLSNATRVSLRGVSQGDPFLSGDPAVGIYVDGVYLARAQGSLVTLFDLDRIEVLRGPQGTLFGKNTIGGAINIVTAKPQFEMGGAAEVRIGNYDTLETRASLNIPLLPEKAAMRFSLATATRDGYLTNQVNGKKHADNKLLGGRMQFLVLPREDLEVLVSLDQTRENRRPQLGKCKLVRPRHTSGTLSQRGGFDGIVADSLVTGFRNACAQDDARSDLKVASDVTFAKDELDTLGASARISWDIAPDLTLTSISAWRRQEFRTTFDLDGTQVALFQDQLDDGGTQADQLSQELQLTGRALDGRLRYVLGLYGFREEGDGESFNGPAFVSLAALGQPIRPGFPDVIPLPARFRNGSKTDNLDYSAFAQATYAVTDRFDVTLGLRHTNERKRVARDARFTRCVGADPLGLCRTLIQPNPGPSTTGIFSGFDRANRFKDLSPMVTLAYTFSQDVRVYASYQSAFQGGGFDGVAIQAIDALELEPEELTSYEVGMKSTWLQDRVLFNTALFYNVVEDERVAFSGLTSSGIFAFSQRNAARDEIRGAEFEVGVLPFAGLQLRANIGLTHAEYKKVDQDEFPGVDIEGNRPTGVPNMTGTFTADYRTAFGSLGTLGLRASWVHRGKMANDAENTRAIIASKVGLLNGRISLELPDGRTELALFGTNLLDRRYFNNGSDFSDSFGHVLRYTAPPRFYGAEIRRQF